MGTWLALLISAALADPTVELLADGGVRGEVLVPAPEARVRAILADASRLPALNPDVVGVQVVRRGACDEVAVSTRGVLAPLRALTRRCPTAGGFKESLVSSEDFTAWDVEWSLSAVPGGTSVVYVSRSRPDLSVPASVLATNQRRSVARMLANLVGLAR